MARDALQLLLSIRRRAVDQARQAIALCLKAEADIQDKMNALDEAARRDHLAARASAERIPFLDMFAARLHQSEAERRALTLAHAAAEARSAEARTALAAARRAAEAVETLLQERKAAATAQMEKRAQHVLDDIARTQHARRRQDAGQDEEITP